MNIVQKKESNKEKETKDQKYIKEKGQEIIQILTLVFTNKIKEILDAIHFALSTKVL